MSCTFNFCTKEKYSSINIRNDINVIFCKDHHEEFLSEFRNITKFFNNHKLGKLMSDTVVVYDDLAKFTEEDIVEGNYLATLETVGFSVHVLSLNQKHEITTDIFANASALVKRWISEFSGWEEVVSRKTRQRIKRDMRNETVYNRQQKITRPC